MRKSGAKGSKAGGTLGMRASPLHHASFLETRDKVIEFSPRQSAGAETAARGVSRAQLHHSGCQTWGSCLPSLEPASAGVSAPGVSFTS